MNDEERKSFRLRRDRLFPICGANEQKALHSLALWHTRLDPRILNTEGWLARCAQYVAMDKAFGWMRALHPDRKVPRPTWLHRALARVHGWLVPFEARRAIAQARNFVTHLRSSESTGQESAFGVASFLLALPLDFGHQSRTALAQDLKAVASDWLVRESLPANLRFEALLRLSRWRADDMRAGPSLNYLGLPAWNLLLQWARGDLPAACSAVDQHLIGSYASSLFQPSSLYEDPQLAFDLALRFEPSRADFAAELLQRSISDRHLQSMRTDAPKELVSNEASDEACKVLAGWLADPTKLKWQTRQSALFVLFRHGNPQSSYWSSLPQLSVDLLADCAEMDLGMRTGRLAEACFYGRDDQACAIHARQYLLAGMQSELERVQAGIDTSAGDWGGALEHLVWQINDLVLDLFARDPSTRRNARVDAKSKHPVVAEVRRLLDEALERLARTEPDKALLARVGVIRGLGYEPMLRDQHRLLREEFETRARAYPREAGEALMLLARVTAYSHTDDNAYKPTLARESFDQLLPILEGISPRDAQVARTGLTWSRRGMI